MRKLSYGLAIAAVLTLGVSQAQAAATFDIVWTGNTGGGPLGTSWTTGGNSDTLTADLVITAGVGGIENFGISLRWDADLALLSWVSTPGAPFNVPLSPGTPVGNQIQTVADSCFFCTGLASGQSKVIGIATFHVANVATDGADVEFFERAGFDGCTQTGGGNAGCINNSGHVDIPEPTALTFMGLGLVGLALAGRRARR